MMIFVNTEKKPRVIIFKGTDKRLNMGLRIKKRSAKASPPNKYDPNPPLIINPPIICEIKNKQRLFMTTDLKSDFIFLS